MQKAPKGAFLLSRERRATCRSPACRRWGPQDRRLPHGRHRRQAGLLQERAHENGAHTKTPGI